MRFSQRIGKTPVKDKLQIESIDSDLHVRLWNVILEHFIDAYEDAPGRGLSRRGYLCKRIWIDFLNKPADQIPGTSNNIFTGSIVGILKVWFDSTEWYNVYDFIEFISEIAMRDGLEFAIECNNALEKEMSGYRIINSKVMQITSEQEIQEIQEAIANTDKFNSVNTHLQTALVMLSDRKNPDYRNSIKEAISAVEAMCSIIANDPKATLGSALKEIEKKHSLHPALKSAFSSLYGYTSDAGGIRHKLTDDTATIEFEDAKFMLVSCSAFINYLKAKMKE